MFYRILYSYVCFMNFAFSSIFKKIILQKIKISNLCGFITSKTKRQLHFVKLDNTKTIQGPSTVPGT